MGNCLFPCARGWGIDLQERKKMQIPGGVPGGGGDMITCEIELEPIPTCWGKFFPFVFVFLQLLVMVYSFSFRSPVFC